MSEKKIAAATLTLPAEAWFNVDVPSKKIEFCVPRDHKDARTLVNLLYELSLAMMNQLEPPPEVYLPSRKPGDGASFRDEDYGESE